MMACPWTTRRAATFSRVVTVVLMAAGASTCRGGPFAVRVVQYDPAPGQFVNHEMFNDSERALGPPAGGGTSGADLSSIVTLGGFGGSITLAFDHTVLDEPLNPFGMDAIVFGNAFWLGGDPQAHWAEPATIEISLDSNGNALADDPWYLIPGSHIADPSDVWIVAHWDDDIADVALPPMNEAWIPAGRSGVWSSEGYALPATLIDNIGRVINPSADPTREGLFGYAEFSPTLVLGDLDGDNIVDDAALTPASFYVRPDDPLTVGMTPGSGGGDAFDIAWAIDPITKEAAGLPGFDFIRITTAVYTEYPTGQRGEVSAEIDAVADVAPDPFGDDNGDGVIDLVDLAAFQCCFPGPAEELDACESFDRESDGWIDAYDTADFIMRITGPRSARTVR